jgi:thiamine pyrophosphate-dependent acetolactate synthase large subunit-like protein
LQREREEREAERKRQEQLKTEKELKTKRYLNKVKQQPNKPIKLVKEEVEEVITVEEPQPTTLWGKFIKWLRT